MQPSQGRARNLVPPSPDRKTTINQRPCSRGKHMPGLFWHQISSPNPRQSLSQWWWWRRWGRQRPESWRRRPFAPFPVSRVGSEEQHIHQREGGPPRQKEDGSSFLLEGNYPSCLLSGKRTSVSVGVYSAGFRPTRGCGSSLFFGGGCSVRRYSYLGPQSILTQHVEYPATNSSHPLHIFTIHNIPTSGISLRLF